MHSFNPRYDGVVEDVDCSVNATLVVKTDTGPRTVPINVPLEESENIFELHNAATQTDELAMHG